MTGSALSEMKTVKDAITIERKRVTSTEYIEFLTRTDLGSQYPAERFHERIRKLLANTAISLIAYNDGGEIVGICFGLTDYAYWLMITDLGGDRDYVSIGIGSEMIRLSRIEAGGDKDIIVFIYANDDAIPFYEKNGLSKSTSMMELTDIEWTSFVVTKDIIHQRCRNNEESHANSQDEAEGL